MDNQKRIEKLKEKDYQKYFGVNKATFDRMLEILEEADRCKHMFASCLSSEFAVSPDKTAFTVLEISVSAETSS